MKKILLASLILTFSTSCFDEDSQQVVELKKRCDKLSAETGEKYIYGSGELKGFKQAVRFIPPPPPTINSLKTPQWMEEPLPYGADIITPEKKQVKFTIRGSWENPDAPLNERKVAPLPISMDTGKNYQFCYKIKKIGSTQINHIDHPETIQRTKE